MNLRPFNSGELEKLKTLGYNPADYAGYDVDAGEAVPQIEVDKRSTLAPSNPYMAAVAEPLLRTGADLYRAGRRFPQAAAEMLLGKDADAGLRTVGATPITGLNFLAEQVLSSAARVQPRNGSPGRPTRCLAARRVLRVPLRRILSTRCSGCRRRPCKAPARGLKKHRQWVQRRGRN
jgi:hypothetical protein